MAVAPETVRRVICSWMAVEVLTPQVIKGGWCELAADRQGQLHQRGYSPNDEEPPPWPLERPKSLESPAAHGRPSEDPENDDPHPWHLVVLGALPAERAFQKLDEAFSDEADAYARSGRSDGFVLAASVVLDEWGVLVPDTIAVASFAWGLGHMLSGGDAADLIAWDDREQDFKQRFADVLSPIGSDGRPRSLTRRDLGAASCRLAGELQVPPELWFATPCTIRLERAHPPAAEILSSFLLSDLRRVLREADRLPDAAAAYFGMQPPERPWNALADREALSALLRPGLFPLGRWPGPGLHPLSLLQQAAVNGIVRDLDRGGLWAVNGPPGTGKTTLLRDLVAHVLVSRAEALAGLEDPCADLAGLDLIDFAVVVASSNNTAVETVSLELPLRGKALDASVWRDQGLDYFGHTASAVCGASPATPDAERAWGLMAARLGSVRNRRAFFKRFWWDPDWGLRDWLDIVAWPDNQNPDLQPGKLATLDPPPGRAEAVRDWQRARDAFRRALGHCREMRAELESASAAGAELRQTEAQLRAVENRLNTLRNDLDCAVRGVETAQHALQARTEQEAVELGKLNALSSVRPSRLARLLRSRSWRAHEASVHGQLGKLDAAQAARQMAEASLGVAVAERDQSTVQRQQAKQERSGLRREADDLGLRLERGRSRFGGAVPGPGFWELPIAELVATAPWNGGAFLAARDELFAAAVRLHRAFVVVAARRIKPALNTIAKAAQGGAGAALPSATDWGIFFLTVPVVSTTFASFGRMFQSFGAGSLGWVLIDEAGQATPQAAAGAIWRARRAVVIGDPLQIEPVVTTPRTTTRLIFEARGADAVDWAAPEHSVQTLADRASRIQGRFRAANGREERITGFPLLVHRRCEEPMFSIANSIAYDGQMVLATAARASLIRDQLGASAWIDVEAPSSGTWVEAEGQLVTAAIVRLCTALQGPPDLYVICPFKRPAARLRELLAANPGVLPGVARKERRAWIERRVGTIHTAQGKEAEAVILMLGAGTGAGAGSRMWVGGTPNLLNVASTRAMRAFYVIGNRRLWDDVGVFAEAARRLPCRPGPAWLPVERPAILPQGALLWTSN